MITSGDETPLQVLIREYGLTLDARFVPRSKTSNASAAKLHEMKINWSVRITRGGNSLTTSYSQGIAHLPRTLQPKPGALRASVGNVERITRALEHGNAPTHDGYYAKYKSLPAPSITDVLHCLILDSDVLNYASFEDWAPEAGFNPDSREAERVYRACMFNALALRRMLTDVELGKLREAFQDY